MTLRGVPSEFREQVSDDGRQVSLAGMHLAAAPEWLKSLTSLTILDLSRNQLASVPEWLGNLASLITLDLSRNQLASNPGIAGEPHLPHHPAPEP